MTPPRTAPRYSQREAAGKLGVPYQTLARLTREGRVPHYRIGTRVRFSDDQLAQILEGWEQAPEVDEGDQVDDDEPIPVGVS